MTLMAYWRGVLRNEIVFGGRPGFDYVFLCCTLCKRVVPLWNVVGKKEEMTRVGCRCGGEQVTPMLIGSVRAFALVVGLYVWRRLILRKAQWDPRNPVKRGGLA